ncbi:hypothetical protein OHA27_37580 [Streptomyces sp. NBC_01619]|nr:hypothetical protein [Streptomyces sp. NBC_01619]MCX4515848.1 hypothetical protein [Streptomyces sp. NBC_01619]
MSEMPTSAAINLLPADEVTMTPDWHLALFQGDASYLPLKKSGLLAV